MNLLDANSVVSTLGLIGVLGIIFMETGLLIGLVFPGGEVVFLAGIAASGSGAAALGDAKLSTPLLFTLAPIAFQVENVLRSKLATPHTGLINVLANGIKRPKTKALRGPYLPSHFSTFKTIF